MEGQKHLCVVASHVAPTGDPACNPGMCPAWGSNLRSLVHNPSSIHWATAARARETYFWLKRGSGPILLGLTLGRGAHNAIRLNALPEKSIVQNWDSPAGGNAKARKGWCTHISNCSGLQSQRQVRFGVDGNGLASGDGFICKIHSCTVDIKLER